MNLLFATRRYPPFIGGSEIQAERLAHGLAARGHAVTVLTGRPERSLPRRIAIEEPESAPGTDTPGSVTICRIDESPTGKLGTALFLSRLVRHIRTIHPCPDALLAFMVNETTAAALWAARRYGIPAAVRLAMAGPGGDLDWTTTQRFGRWYRRALHRADALIGHAETYRDDLERFGLPLERFRAIPNGVPAGLFDIPRRYDSPARTILWIGRLEPQKDPLKLADLAAGLNARGLDYRLSIVGEGSLSDDLRRSLADDLDAGRAAIHNFTDDLAPHYRNADLFVMTSRTEGMPNVLLEAMAAGLPCVAPSVGAIPAAIDDGRTGLLTPPGDVDSLADRLASLFESTVLRRRLGEAAHRYATSQFHESMMLDRYEALLHTLSVH